jgi:hypothetical protein
MEFSTGNSDLAVQLNERFLKSVLAAAYFTGRIPDFLEGTIDTLFFGIANWALYLDCPTLHLLPTESGQPARARMSVAFTLRLSTRGNEWKGLCSFVVPIVLDTRMVDGAQAQFLRLDLTQVPNEDVTFTLTPPLPAMEIIGRAELMAQLRTQFLEVPITPLVGGEVFLAFSVSADPTKQAPKFGAILEPDYLSLFVNLDGQSMTPPAVHPPQLWLSSNTKQRDQDCALAIPESAFMPPLRAAIAKVLANGQVIPGTEKKVLKNEFTGVSFPFHVVGSEDVTLELKDGHLRLATGVTVVIDSLPDVSAAVDAKLMFGLGTDKLSITILNADSMIDIDIPFGAQVVLGVLTSALSLIIEQATEEVLESVLEGIVDGKTVAIPLPQKSIFLGGIAVTTGPAEPDVPSLVVSSSGLEVFSQGLIIRSWLDLVYEHAPRNLPPYVRAHTFSKEFHKEGCGWGKRIGAKNLAVFIRPDIALNQGYDGCNFCYPEFDGLRIPGTLVLYFWKSGFAPFLTHAEEVTWKCEFLSETLKTGTTETRTRTKSEEIATTELGQYMNYAKFDGLRPGKWRATVSNAGWTTQTTVGVRGDRTQGYRFTFGEKKSKKA